MKELRIYDKEELDKMTYNELNDLESKARNYLLVVSAFKNIRSIHLVKPKSKQLAGS